MFITHASSTLSYKVRDLDWDKQRHEDIRPYALAYTMCTLIKRSYRILRLKECWQRRHTHAMWGIALFPVTIEGTSSHVSVLIERNYGKEVNHHVTIIGALIRTLFKCELWF